MKHDAVRSCTASERQRRPEEKEGRLFFGYCALLKKCRPRMCGTEDDKGVQEGEGRLCHFEK